MVATAQLTTAHPTTALDRGYRLEDRYERRDGRVHLTGTQALVRLGLAQAARDRAAGLRTAGFVSGYRGSPLGAVDQEMWKAGRLLERAGVRFQPAVNEDLAATAVLGSQQVESDPLARVEGVFALWYGKGPGVDRSGDALRHGNAYGSSPRGGVLVAVGDDHGCVSSSMSHQSDQTLMAWLMPVLNPASLADYQAFGRWGWALSRFSGNWVGFKAISETVEGAGSVLLDEGPALAVPADFRAPPGRLHYRWPDLPGPAIEQRLHAKLDAVRAFARANPWIDRPVLTAPQPRLGIVTAGKAHGDLMEALRVAGLSEQALAAAGLSILKLGLTFPIERERLGRFAAGLATLIVVEEKGGVVEPQLKDLLYHLPADRRPAVLGKSDERGAPFIPADRELRPSLLLPILAPRLRGLGLEPRLLQRGEPAPAPVPGAARTPYFCSGCPHNSSTRVPEGSRAKAGIGCHFMANWMDRETGGLTQMGGEGVDWTGLAPFTGQRHVFQNLGDGTYFHSGHMAIRQAIAAGVNVTYKLLYNDAVAMTGGQPVDGVLSVPQITRILAAEGVKRIAVVSDEPDKYPLDAGFAAGTTLHHRRELDAVQRELREVPGVSLLVYDQTCAAEKRRRRKLGTFPDPDRRVVINERVCEGCGDCQKKSNCLSVVPLDTDLGRKRTIDQSSCNKDYSCVEGFCPSFVSVSGVKLRRGGGAGLPAAEGLAQAGALPRPETALGDAPFEILVAGVGGTGVVTVGALIAMAAHLEGRGASVLDFTGFAQKGGPVLSHVRLAADPSRLNQVRIDRASADALLACDLIVANGPEALATLRRGRSRVVANRHEIQTGAQLRDATARPDPALLEKRLAERVGPDAFDGFDAQRLAQALLGDTIGANILLLGYAWQRGLVPVSLEALERAIELNGVAVAANRLALAWGRLAAAAPDAVAAATAPAAAEPVRPRTLDELLERRAAFLTGYQDAAYAARFRQRIERLRAAEATVSGAGETALSEAAAESLFRLMAIKDEYEVARLHSDGAFLARLAREFEGRPRLTFHLAPPVLATTPPGGTEPRKLTFGPWILPVLKVLAKGRRLRGTALDPFGHLPERKAERALLADFEAFLDEVTARLADLDRGTLLALLRLPQDIRGFGPVKERAMQAAAARRADLLAKLQQPAANHKAPATAQAA